MKGVAFTRYFDELLQNALQTEMSVRRPFIPVVPSRCSAVCLVYHGKALGKIVTRKCRPTISDS